MEKSPTKKEQTHDRIVDAAARALRRHGYAGVGVADVMKDAGLTHGGFYAHFESRDALFVAALERASRGSRALLLRRTEALRERDISAFRALVEGYLHDDLLKSNEAGCPVAALCSEMPRQSAEVHKASTVGVRALLRREGAARSGSRRTGRRRRRDPGRQPAARARSAAENRAGPCSPRRARPCSTGTTAPDFPSRVHALFSRGST